MSEAFLKAAEEVKTFKTEPSDSDKLELYAFYKQATVGDCNTGTSKDAAETAYIAKVEELKKTCS
ncbi:Acyl-CoA-binding protein [Acropora cervicornis]|uniref:Acyl-CoA-binding protein n=1 Tax=Acropora cervicornis TaxID=6130 RepID=A0AAD9QHY5_ACRCE|nr:Acyl-CoA-binding protein [Acropora cervicornis]